MPELNKIFCPISDQQRLSAASSLNFCFDAPSTSPIDRLIIVRVALVTGGNRGMGFEICWQLASSGLAVVLTARDERRGTEAAARLRGLGLQDIVFHQLDIAEPASAARLAGFVRNKFGKLNVLVSLVRLSLP